MNLEDERNILERKMRKLEEEVFFQELAHQIKLWFEDPDLMCLMCIFDMGAMKFLRVSESSKKILGWDRSEMEGKIIDKYALFWNTRINTD